jgi:hypothetical protein
MHFKGANCKLTLLTHLVKQVLILSALLFLISMLVVRNRGVGSRTQQEYIQDEITLRVENLSSLYFIDGKGCLP